MDNCIPVNMPMETRIHLISLLPNEERHNVEQYQSIIGVLNYAAVLTRPDIATAVGFLA